MVGNPRNELLVEKYLSNGHGLSRNPDGQIVFVPGGLPGEQYRPGTLQKKKGVLWAGAVQRIISSPLRTEPACPHADACGGCQLLHLRRDGELGLKLDALRDVLTRVGKLESQSFVAQDFSFHQSRIRGKLHVDSQKRVGFKQEKGHAVTTVTSCMVIPASVAEALPELSRWSRRTGFAGELYFNTQEDGEHPVFLAHGRWQKKLVGPELEKGGFAVSEPGGELIQLVGEPFSSYVWNGFQVSLRPDVFCQSNPKTWPAFFSWVKDFVAASGARRLWDVHAGAGFLTSAVDPSVSIVASEPNALAYSQLAALVQQRGGQALEAEAEQVIQNKVLPQNKLDGALLDPPRSGLTQTLTTWLVRRGPAYLLYISCDMATFARDLRKLSERYAIKGPVEVLNLNPGTLRLEVAATLWRRP